MKIGTKNRLRDIHSEEKDHLRCKAQGYLKYSVLVLGASTPYCTYLYLSRYRVYIDRYSVQVPKCCQARSALPHRTALTRLETATTASGLASCMDIACKNFRMLPTNCSMPGTSLKSYARAAPASCTSQPGVAVGRQGRCPLQMAGRVKHKCNGISQS